MSTSSKEQAAAAPSNSGKGMSGNADDSTPKSGTGGGSNNPKPGQDHGPKDKDKKGPASKG
jgi:hypothetical protein